MVNSRHNDNEEENVQDATRHPRGKSVGSRDKTTGVTACHGICVSDLATIMRNLEQEGEDLGLETGWDDHTDDHHQDLEVDQEVEQRLSARLAKNSSGANKKLYTIRGSDGSSDKETYLSNSLEDEEAGVGKMSAQDEEKLKKAENGQLVQASLNTALAIAIHNFPEGLATFIAALGDAKVGFVLAFAIAIHNIPEGLCVALPIYFAKKSKAQAFAVAFLSGLTEPLAALLGWAVLANHLSDPVYGACYGVVSGMMVVICIRDLIPTARRYDEHDVVSTKSFGAGMLVMAFSLVLFMW